MIQQALPKAPERQKARPRLGAGVARGLFIFARLYRAYSRTGYIPLKQVRGSDRRDLWKAYMYCWRLASWKFWKDRDRRMEAIEDEE